MDTLTVKKILGFRVEYQSGKNVHEQDVCMECYSDPIFHNLKVVRTYHADYEKNVDCPDCGKPIIEH